MSKVKYTKEILQDAVDNSISVAGVLRHLGLRQAGGTHSHISRKIKDFKIDTAHFLGQKSNSGNRHKGGPKKKTHKEILILRDSGPRTKTSQLIRALIEVGVKYECSNVKCSISDVWNDKKIVLQVDHINGNWLDNRRENIRFICPNCHSQTEGFSRRKDIKGR